MVQYRTCNNTSAEDTTCSLTGFEIAWQKKNPVVDPQKNSELYRLPDARAMEHRQIGLSVLFL